MVVGRLLLNFTYIYINFKFFRIVQHWVTIQKQRNERKILLYSVKGKNINPYQVCVVVLYLIAVFLYGGAHEGFEFIIIFIVLGICMYFSFPQYNNIIESNNLNIGYGAALCYYKNYLTFVLPYKFKERIEYFKSYHRVEVQNKLYILIPQSCKVQRYLESPETENIERCRELRAHEESYGGIKDRIYNMTVYLIKNEDHPKGVRLAVEYAQPLKGLFALKDKQKISMEEMLHERQLFVQALNNFIRQDVNDLHKYCELIEYNDIDGNVADVLLERVL